MRRSLVVTAVFVCLALAELHVGSRIGYRQEPRPADETEPLDRPSWFSNLFPSGHGGGLSRDEPGPGGRTGPDTSRATVRYLVTVDDPSARTFRVEVELSGTGEETLVSLPAYTPGNHTIHDYAQKVKGFEVHDPEGTPLDWDKVDKDTWRVASAGTDRVRLAYNVVADTIHVSSSWLTEGFGFFNGTNLFVYPETGYNFASTVRIEVPGGWRIATELQSGDEPGLFRADDYHELVDQPTFLGHFAMDSVQVDGAWIRLAVHPGNQVYSQFGRAALDVLQSVGGYFHDLIGGPPPYDRYTAFVFLSSEPLPSYGGLEHADSHLDILPSQEIDRPDFQPFVQRLLAHEYFHAWNVKRLRPAELWPYDYSRAGFTPLLWFSEGVTDYYADLALVRTGVWSEARFWENLTETAETVDAADRASVEDASVDTWIEPVYVPENYHYAKGKLIALLLDAVIRDATDGRQSLDDIVRQLYRKRYLEGKGFSTKHLVTAVGERIGEERALEFYTRYIDGREALPCDSILKTIGIDYAAETVTEPSLGAVLSMDPKGSLTVDRVRPGGAAAGAGLRAGDVLVRLGEVTVEGPTSVATFYRGYADRIGESVTIAYRRDGQTIEGEMALRTRSRRLVRIAPDTAASERGRRLREALLAQAASSR